MPGAHRTRPIVLNAFSMNTVGHINHGLWTHPRDRSGEYHSLDYRTGLARELERGLFDSLFLADIVGVYDTYGQSADVTLRESVQLPVSAPVLVVPAMAAATRHLSHAAPVPRGNWSAPCARRSCARAATPAT
ncbi:hypothetical protein C8E08_4233 [Paracidovorax citrulli]|uniref:Uncharacterized protein n=1 Tax=Paracidovorax citrulli (strain AAC00-1) TaxID=397945 RepID=A1TNQ3_PARC0|nr:hypothetical protein Aave_2007 [Paracidovorax citrulli AAC00-1]PVY66810.1 hypothetical protein C8E08_4233 [Paracidovorax citrulli]SDK98928.1 hypothetical protein SAMN04489709_12841 [Paracidovorax citrulli]